MNNKSKVMSLLLTGCLLLSGCSTILEKDVIATSNIKTNESTVIHQTSATIQLNEGTNTIEKSGTYEVAGTVKDGSLIIDIDKEVDSGLVTIILNQVEIHSSNSAPIYVKGASEVLIILKEGTTNTLTQGKDIIEDAEGEPNAVLYSKADITLQGPGSLLVLSEYNDGIVSKDTLTIQSGSYEIEVVGDGIVGKDLLEVFDGDFNITTGGGFSSSAMSSSNSNLPIVPLSPQEKIAFIQQASNQNGQFIQTQSFPTFTGKAPKDNFNNGQFILFMKLVSDSDGNQLVIYMTSMITPVTATITTLRAQLWVITGILFILSVGLALLISRKVSKPIEEINTGAKSLAKGDYEVEFHGEGFLEIEELSRTLNTAANELSQVDKLRKELLANVSHDLRTPIELDLWLCGGNARFS